MSKEWSGERLETFVFNDATLEHLHRYALALEFCKGKTVLDIACGEGYGSNLLAQVAVSATGIDVDETTIANAQKKYQPGNLKFLTGDIAGTDIPSESYDTIVSFETLEHVSTHDQVIKELKRLLKPDGLLIISTPDKKRYSDLPGYRNPYHKKELYEQEFRDLLNARFKFVSIVGQELVTASIIHDKENTGFDIYEGTYEHITRRSKLDPMYLIALCSDAQQYQLSSSIFTSAGTIETAVKEKERSIKSSLSYRIGHGILWPLKTIRKIFSR